MGLEAFDVGATDMGYLIYDAPVKDPSHDLHRTCPPAASVSSPFCRELSSHSMCLLFSY